MSPTNINVGILVVRRALEIQSPGRDSDARDESIEQIIISNSAETATIENKRTDKDQTIRELTVNNFRIGKRKSAISSIFPATVSCCALQIVSRDVFLNVLIVIPGNFKFVP